MLHETVFLREGREDVFLKTYAREKRMAERPRPAVIVCPGGAYAFCSDGEGEPVALRFNAMGYHAFVLQYSVRGMETKRDPAQTVWPQPLYDLAAAVLYLKDHAAHYNVDPAQIAVIGFSAGGHLAGMYATSWCSPLLQAHFARPEEDFRVAAAMLIYAVSDWRESFKVNLGEGKAEFDTYLLGRENAALADYDAISPACLVTEKTLPCFLVHGQDDPLVAVECALKMASALRAHNIPFALHIFETANHGFSLADESTSSYEFERKPDIAVWAELAHTWLQKRLTVKLGKHCPWPMPDGR